MKINFFLNQTIKKKISKHGKANLILSGGKSTIGVYKMLSKQKLPWEKVFVYLLDERIVSKKNINSNYGSLKKIFSKNSKIKIVDLIEIYKKKNFLDLSKKFKKCSPILIMGIGSDGHIASIFKNSKIFAKATKKLGKKKILKTEKKIGSPAFKRLTMNFPLILMSEKIIVVAQNKNKKKLLYKIMNNDSYYSNSAANILLKTAKSKIMIFNGIKLKSLQNFKFKV